MSFVVRFTAVLGAAALVLGGGTSAFAATPQASATPTSSYTVQHLCSAAKPGTRECFAEKRVPKSGTVAQAVSPDALPSGFGPADLSSAYALPSTGGSGVTVAIVDAYNDPTAESDLGTYRSTYGLSACTTANGCFTKVSQTGSTTSLPSTDTGWSGEIALDIQMVSAACPACHILLVEASSANNSDLDTAVNYAAAHATVVSNSYGGTETSSDTSDSAYNHAGVSIFASSGDQGYVTEFPAAASTVIGVGGTALTRATGTTRGWTEKVWNTSNSEGAGSGCSKYETKPSWQKDTGCTKRTVSDISAVADPATGVAVYDTTGGSGWTVYGGTSVASPLVSAIFAVTGHAGTSASYIYANPSFFNDVTSGQTASSCSSYLCKAQAGYDGPTGIGTPIGSALNGGTTTPSNDFSLSATGASVTAGSTGTSSITTATTSGSAQSVSLSASGAPSGVTVSFSPTSVTSGSGSTATITVASTVAAGSYSITVTGSATSGTHTTTIPLTVTAATSTCTQSSIANPGFESGTASWTASSGVINTDGAHAHAGSGYAWLDGYGSTHTDTLSQSIKVPNCTTDTLSYWLSITTAETSTTAYDKLTVSVGSTVLATYSNLNKSSGYLQKTVNLSSYKGQTVTLSFKGAEDNSLQTSFFLDDLGLTGQ